MLFYPVILRPGVIPYLFPYIMYSCNREVPFPLTFESRSIFVLLILVGTGMVYGTGEKSQRTFQA